MTDFVHPETGEILCSQEEWRAALVAVEERLAPIYRVRRALRDGYTERFPAPELPSRTRRTETQEKIARCPRCGEKLEDGIETYHAEMQKLREELQQLRGE